MGKCKVLPPQGYFYALRECADCLQGARAGSGILLDNAIRTTFTLLRLLPLLTLDCKRKRGRGRGRVHRELISHYPYWWALIIIYYYSCICSKVPRKGRGNVNNSQRHLLLPSLSVSFALSSLQKISPPSQFKWNLILFWQKAKAIGKDCEITKPVQEATLAFSLPGASSRTHFERILSQ